MAGRRNGRGSGRWSFDAGETPERPADPEVRRANLRRIAGLFKGYKLPLGTVLALICLSSLLGIISPFLLRAVLDTAIPEKDVALLTALVAGMIAISIVTGALGVVQTYMSNVVGQQVMHDLRSAVYRHLQRLSLAFFTRTRTGEIQSRIANDIGGVETVVTSTATSIVSNLTTVIATIVAMFLLDWRLAVFSLGLLPFFVFLTRRVGGSAGRSRRRSSGRWQTSRRSSRSRCPCRASCSAARWAARRSWATASRGNPGSLPGSRSPRAWPAAG